MSSYPPGALAEMARREEKDEMHSRWRRCVLREMAQLIESTRERAEHFASIADDLGYDREAGFLGDLKCDCATIQGEFRA